MALLRPSRIIALAGSVALFAALMLLPVPSESQADIPVVGVTTNLLWDHECKDIDGNVEILSRFDMAISDATVNLATGGVPLTVVAVPYPCPQCTTNTTTLGTTCNYSIAQLLVGRLAGTYQLWVRAADSAGNISAWSVPLTVRYDKVPPKPPTGLKCK